MKDDCIFGVHNERKKMKKRDLDTVNSGNIAEQVYFVQQNDGGWVGV